MRFRGGAFAGLLLALAAPAAAQVDPSGPWRTWTSRHFRVHARAELAPRAAGLVREAERAYRLLAAELRPPRGRIDIALLDNVDYSNGLTSVFPSNRIVLYLPPPSGQSSLAVYDDWLRLVTVHELTHVFHLDRAEGIWRVLRSVMGRNPALFPNAYRSSWVSEGLATYYESRFTSAGRLRGGFHPQLLAAAAGSDQWPSPNDASFGSVRWPRGFRPYAWGSRFFQAQVDLHGDSVVPRFIERTSSRLWPLAVSGPLEGAGGHDVRAGWRALREHWRRPAPAPEGRIVARGLRSDPQPRVSPDGTFLAYVRSDGRQIPAVVVVDRSDGRAVARHSVTDQVDLDWLGDRLYLTQLDFTSPVQVLSDLYRWRPGGAWERLTTGERVRHPFALPGDGVGVVATHLGERRPARYADGSIALSVPPGEVWERVTTSPDGRWMAGARHLNGRWDIVIWPTGDPAGVVAVTDDAAFDGQPAWAADGTLLFTSEREGHAQIFCYDPGGGLTRRLTDEPSGARSPAPAPDGTVYYVTMLADGHAVVAAKRGRPGTVEPLASRPTAPDTAATVAVTVGRYNPWPALIPRYWTPIWHREETTGVFFGMTTSSGDVIGRSAYTAFVTVAPGTGRWEGALAVRHTRWRAWALDAGLDQTWEFAGFATTPGGTSLPVGLRERFARIGISRFWRRWRSAVTARIGAEAEQDAFLPDDDSPEPIAFPNRWFGGAVISVSARHWRRQAFSISPEDGAAVTLLYRRRWELGGPGWNDEWRGAFTGYLGLSLPGFAKWVLALATRGAASGGPTPNRFALGGETSGRFELVPGLELGGARRSFPLRGYPANAERFTRVFAGAVELRVPVVLIGRAIWQLPLGVNSIGLTAFAEAGGGWSEGESARLIRYRDIGAELLAALFVGYDVPLLVRGGAAVPLTDGLGAIAGDLRGYVAVGLSF